MSNSRPYTEYTDSRQEWLGELPSHWKLIKTKYLFDLITEQAPVGNNEELLSVYTALGVRPRKELEERGNKASTTDNYWIVKKQDIIVNKLLAWMGAIGISEYDGVTSPAYDILRKKSEINPYYYNYLFRSPIANKEFKRHSRGIMEMRLRLYFNRFGDIKLPCPSLEEQNNIVSFLNFKLAKIDRFIRKKRKLIKLLNEQKAVIINNAVTKGIFPDVEIKESNIDWIGEIPKHWEVRKLKYDFSLNGRIGYHGLSSTDFRDEGILLITGTDLIRNRINWDTCYKVDEEWYDVDPFIQLSNGELLVTKDGTIGKTAIVSDLKGKAILNSGLFVVRAKNETIISNEYLQVLINSILFELFIAVNKTGSTIHHLYQKTFYNFPIIVPPREEQNQIIDFITQESIQINTTISKIESEISLTQEYRTALISEAVTGKIDVRDFQIPDIQEEQDAYEEIEEELSIAAESEPEYLNEDDY